MIKGKADSTPGVKYVPAIGKNIEITYNYIKHSSRHPIRRWTINNLNQALLNQINSLSLSRIIDVGCGEGYVLNFLGQKLKIKMEGVDLSPVAINLGRALFPKLDLKIADIYHLPHKDNSYDLVICTEVLEHLEYPKDALKELIRISKRYIVLSIPNEPFFSLKNLLIGRNIKRLGNTKGHINLWTSWGFRKFVKKENLKILSIMHPFPFILVLAQKTK